MHSSQGVEERAEAGTRNVRAGGDPPLSNSHDRYLDPLMPCAVASASARARRRSWAKCESESKPPLFVLYFSPLIPAGYRAAGVPGNASWLAIR